MRRAEIKRSTKETQIFVSLSLDGNGEYKINTGIGFFDHMLELFSAHSGFDLTVDCTGDLRVDGHHTVEDIGIALGSAFSSAIGDKRGIKRYSSKKIPMDEALAEAVIDISGRPFLVYSPDLAGKAGDFDLELLEEFFRAFTVNAGITLHISLLYGKNNHHKAEAIIKAVARTLKSAVKITGDKIPSTKGML